MSTTNRMTIFNEIIESMDTAYDLMNEYDILPHRYGEEILYQSESHMVSCIGKNPQITITELANIQKKTTSACSQIVRKLRQKGWVKQVRNKNNNREYNLYLTEEGWKVYQDHEKFDSFCYARTYGKLSNFTDEELKLYLSIQKVFNDAFTVDVAESLKYFDKI